MTRYIPHAVVILLILLLPVAVSVLLGLTAFACYTAVIWVGFAIHAPFVELKAGEALKLAAVDVYNLFRF